MNTSAVADNWERGETYEAFMGRWSRLVAPKFLAWLDVPAIRRWLDVGCGTGALCAEIVDTRQPASVICMDPSQGFLEVAAKNLGGRAGLIGGSAESIPLADDSVDAVVSALVLNFVPDQAEAVREMVRVTVNGGRIGTYLWDYSGRMEFLRHFWDAVVELDPGASALDEGIRFPICNHAPLSKLLENSGLRNAEVTAIDIATRFESFAAYWEPFLGGQGPAPAYVMSLDPPARDRLRDHLSERLPIQSDGSISMIARVWAARGDVTK